MARRAEPHPFPVILVVAIFLLLHGIFLVELCVDLVLARPHAALSVAAVTGCWQYEGGGAFHSNSGIFKLDKGLLEGTKLRDPDVRYLDHSRIGPVLMGHDVTREGSAAAPTGR